jgi:hypothetical protein
LSKLVIAEAKYLSTSRKYLAVDKTTVHGDALDDWHQIDRFFFSCVDAELAVIVAASRVNLAIFAQ